MTPRIAPFAALTIALHPSSSLADPPEHEASDAEARVRLEAILDELDPDKRAVFVMFEVDGMSCDEIAAFVGAPRRHGVFAPPRRPKGV